jgi:hypothetical protein
MSTHYFFLFFCSFFIFPITFYLLGGMGRTGFLFIVTLPNPEKQMALRLIMNSRYGEKNKQRERGLFSGISFLMGGIKKGNKTGFGHTMGYGYWFLVLLFLIFLLPRLYVCMYVRGKWNCTKRWNRVLPSPILPFCLLMSLRVLLDESFCSLPFCFSKLPLFGGGGGHGRLTRFLIYRLYCLFFPILLTTRPSHAQESVPRVP